MLKGLSLIRIISNLDFLDPGWVPLKIRYRLAIIAEMFLEALYPIFCKSKKCIISNIDYRPGSKKYELDMTLTSDSPFKDKVVSIFFFLNIVLNFPGMNKYCF